MKLSIINLSLCSLMLGASVTANPWKELTHSCSQRFQSRDERTLVLSCLQGTEMLYKFRPKHKVDSEKGNIDDNDAFDIEEGKTENINDIQAFTKAVEVADNSSLPGLFSAFLIQEKLLDEKTRDNIMKSAPLETKLTYLLSDILIELFPGKDDDLVKAFIANSAPALWKTTVRDLANYVNLLIKVEHGIHTNAFRDLRQLMIKHFEGEEAFPKPIKDKLIKILNIVKHPKYKNDLIADALTSKTIDYVTIALNDQQDNEICQKFLLLISLWESQNKQIQAKKGFWSFPLVQAHLSVIFYAVLIIVVAPYIVEIGMYFDRGWANDLNDVWHNVKKDIPAIYNATVTN